MSKKSKEKELDFFYLNQEEKGIPKKQKKKANQSRSTTSKKKNTNSKMEVFSDDEIIIGVNTKPKKAESQSQNKPKGKARNKNTSKKDKQKNKVIKEKKKDLKKRKKSKLISLLIKIVIIFILLGIGIAYLITSPTFNVAKIEIVGNQKIPSDTYISLSGITIGNNIYDLSKRTIIEHIKQNPYVDTVTIKRRLPDTIEITVTERKATYMLGILNSYAYINNQGYILEINEEEINTPIITGYTTQTEKIVPGNRLNDEDLLRLEMVLKIMDAISISGITETVNEIDISDKTNYTLKFYEEGKVAYLGDASNLTDRINIYLKAILQKEKGKEGEIFINGDLNQDKVFFRERV